MDTKPVLWMGYRERQRPGMYAQRTENKTVILGSKCFFCVRDGLLLLWNAINHTGKLGRYDLAVSHLFQGQAFQRDWTQQLSPLKAF